MFGSGPDLGDFIGGVVPRNKEDWDEYSGKLKLDKVRLIKFLKIQIFALL